MNKLGGGLVPRFQGERPQGFGAARMAPGRDRKSGPSLAAHWCSCGREILQGSHGRRWPLQCAMCREGTKPPRVGLRASRAR